MKDTNTINWVFGYGSLMWNPGFEVEESVRATVTGFARSFCLRSIEHRGTPEQPGLVLGLDAQENASCTGLALRFSDDIRDAVLKYLRIRELVTDAYEETIVPLELEDGREVQALAYVIRKDHWQYAGGLPDDEQVQMILQAHGGRGPNTEYLFNTTRCLMDYDIQDEGLQGLSDKVEAILQENEADDR